MVDNVIRHFSVMAANVIKKMGNYPRLMPLKVADCNFGFGGHSKLILQKFPNSLIQAYDLDPKVIDYFRKNYEKEMCEQEIKRLTIAQSNFSRLSQTKIFDRFDIILADFGFCSYHIQTERGFSWQKDQPLDMRYSQQDCMVQLRQINQSSQLELMAILKRYGDLKGVKTIAQALIAARPLLTTQQLREAVVGCFQEDKTRKIAQVFQAFRVATNNQIKDIEKLCLSLDKCLAKGGLFIAITFHSLERDVIHGFMRQSNKSYEKVEVQEPSRGEMEANSKSRSAKMLSVRKLV